jgi:hypothetical protein
VTACRSGETLVSELSQRTEPVKPRVAAAFFLTAPYLPPSITFSRFLRSVFHVARRVGRAFARVIASSLYKCHRAAHFCRRHLDLKGAPPLRPRARADARTARFVRRSGRTHSERGEDAEHQLARRRCGVDRFPPIAIVPVRAVDSVLTLLRWRCRLVRSVVALLSFETP